MRPAARRRAAVLVLMAASAGIGAGGCGSEQRAAPAEPLTRAEVRAALATPMPAVSAPAKRLERAAGTVLPGSGKQAVAQLDAIVASLRGTPLVVNLWGEWCAPCKQELPLLQRAALAHRGDVVFLGVATLSTRARSEQYLRTKIALPYPSLLDDPGALNRGTGIDSVPKTFFYDAAGRRTIHQGPYATAADLDADIARYAAAAG
ncbi:MAG: TlpA disulfide reductase family protein [Patulibacter sp.]